MGKEGEGENLLVLAGWWDSRKRGMVRRLGGLTRCDSLRKLSSFSILLRVCFCHPASCLMACWISSRIGSMYSGLAHRSKST